MTTPTAPARIRDFVDVVASHFDDLPESDRQDLLDDLEQHLLELAAEDEQQLAAELTSPAAYATELRHSAGLPERDSGPGATSSRLRRLVDRSTARVHSVAAWPPVARTLEFLPELRPAWWLVRAWASVAVLFMVATGGPWTRHIPIPGRNLLGVLALVGAAAVSVKVGREGTDRARWWRIANAAAAVATVVAVFGALAAGPTVQYVEIVHEAAQPPILRHPDGEPITNLYLYDLDGNPVTDVLVHDGLGRPVEIGDLEASGFEDIETVFRRDRFGVPVRHLYPLEQYLVGRDPADRWERRPRPEPFPDPTDDADGEGDAVQPDAEPEASPSPASSPPPSTGDDEPDPTTETGTEDGTADPAGDDAAE